MPAPDSIILLIKFNCAVFKFSNFRSKKGERFHSPRTEEELVLMGSDVATVLVSALSFSKRFFFSSFSNASIFSILRQIISPLRSLKKACCFSRRFIFIRFSDNNARVARSSLLMRERSFSILTKSDKETSTALHLILRRT